MWKELLRQIQDGHTKSLARAITLVENEFPGYENLLEILPPSKASIIGLTGPPGAGKSTLVDALVGELVAADKKIAVLCVDPSSPFNAGALLGDRVRMSEWYNHPSVYIRSLATRGSLGGLNPKIIELTDLVKASGVDHVLVETVGVGQSEIEISGLADITIVAMVPEAGDEVQTMKAGLMEIADIFVVNKSDRPDADLFVKNLSQMLAPVFHTSKVAIPIIKTIASQKMGLPELMEAILQKEALLRGSSHSEKRAWLLAEKAYQLIQRMRMRDISKPALKQQVEASGTSFNLYQFVKNFEEGLESSYH